MDPTSVVSVILVLGGLIFFHELGHFLVARLLKMGVVAFSLGFGPKIFSVVKGGTTYALSAIPLGGYVQLVAQDAGEPAPEGFGRETWFCLRPAWQRTLVVAAGPLFNFFLAWLIFWGLLFTQGRFEVLPVIGTVQEGSAAQAAGLAPGDRITAVDGREILYWRELAATIRASAGKTLRVSVERDGRPLDLSVAPRVQTLKNIFGEEEKVALMGVGASGETTTVPLGTGSSLVEACVQTWDVVSMTFTGIVKVVQRVVPLDTLGGPIMIAQMVSKQAHEGLADVLALMAVISVNLGILNLLPIPVLDGGHILFFGLETIFRRPVSVKWQQLTTRFGLAFLLLLMALAIYNDIQRILV